MKRRFCFFTDDEEVKSLLASVSKRHRGAFIEKAIKHYASSKEGAAVLEYIRRKDKKAGGEWKRGKVNRGRADLDVLGSFED